MQRVKELSNTIVKESISLDVSIKRIMKVVSLAMGVVNIDDIINIGDTVNLLVDKCCTNPSYSSIDLNEEGTQLYGIMFYGKTLSINGDCFFCKFILRVDKSIIGRFAGDIRDLIALASSRYVTSKKMLNSDASNLARVEIGTLFGASAILTDYAIKANSASNKFQNIMIDPLDGYYGNSNDLVSGLEVNAKTLFKNLKMFNVEGYKLIQKYSTDNQTINKIKEFSIVSLFIDGDHSFSGLLKDWNNFNKVLEQKFKQL